MAREKTLKWIWRDTFLAIPSKIEHSLTVDDVLFPNERYILVLLWGYMKGDGEKCFLGVEELARISGYSRQWVGKILKDIVAKKWLLRYSHSERFPGRVKGHSGWLKHAYFPGVPERFINKFVEYGGSLKEYEQYVEDKIMPFLIKTETPDISQETVSDRIARITRLKSPRESGVYIGSGVPM